MSMVVLTSVGVYWECWHLSTTLSIFLFYLRHSVQVSWKVDPGFVLIVQLKNLEQLKRNNLTVAIQLGCFRARIQNQALYPAGRDEEGNSESDLPSGWCAQDVWTQK